MFKKMFKNKFSEPVIIILLLCVVTVFVSLLDGDRELARLALEPDGKWFGKGRYPWTLFYDYAAWPGFIMAGAALLTLLAGFFKKTLARYRGQAFFLILLLIMGPGLIVNVTLKDNLGRARPSELKEFGGQNEFTQPWFPGKMGDNSSFPSGHASVAFYLMAPWFILRSRAMSKAAVFLGVGLGFGVLVGITRILQGGHFLTDVIWAGGLVYLTGYLLAQIFRLDQRGDGGSVC